MLDLSERFIDLDQLVGEPIEIRLVLEPEVLARGETCRLSWEVSGAEDVRIWHTDVKPTAQPLDWYAVFEGAEPVSRAGESDLAIERPTAVFLVARSESQIRGERLLIEVETEEGKAADFDCDPTEGVLEKMQSARHISSVTEFERGLPFGLWDLVEFDGLNRWSAPPAPPSISIGAPNPVIFTDESSTVTWKVTDTNCVTTGETIDITRLVADPTSRSGSKYDGGGWGSGWTVSCGGGNPGSRTLAGNQGKRHTVIHVHASNAAAKSGAKSQWVDTLGVPKFEGNATAARNAWVRATFKKIDAKLREGRVISDGYLDSTVKAFKMGCMTRTGTWARMLAELENLDITSVKCEDTQDPAKPYASFEEYSGRIFLRWKPGHAPSEYALCHELVHKAGFHGSLFACGLSVAEIECGADHVASAILGLQPDPC